MVKKGELPFIRVNFCMQFSIMGKRVNDHSKGRIVGGGWQDLGNGVMIKTLI
jgi:hypothetical protein